MQENLCGDMVYDASSKNRLGRVRAVSIAVEGQSAGALSTISGDFILLVEGDDGRLFSVRAVDVTTQAKGFCG